MLHSSRDNSSKVCTSQIIADKYFEWWQKSDLGNLQTYDNDGTYDNIDSPEKMFVWNDLPKLIHPQVRLLIT